MCGCVDMKPPALSSILMIEREYDEKLRREELATLGRCTAPKMDYWRMLLLAGEAGVLEEEEASGGGLAGGDVTGVLAEVALVAVALLFEA